jgi:hypothetical protein
VAGGDHVKVDLQRANAAASALEGLWDALAQHVPAILTAISNLRSEGATLPPPTALQQLQGRSPQDAAEMRAAARIATVMNNQLLAQQPPIIVTGKLDLGTSWNIQALDSAAATADAQALLTAQTSTGKQAARTAILGVTQDLADHQGDTRYLTAFWSQNGAALTCCPCRISRSSARSLRGSPPSRPPTASPEGRTPSPPSGW